MNPFSKRLWWMVVVQCLEEEEATCNVANGREKFVADK